MMKPLFETMKGAVMNQEKWTLVSVFLLVIFWAAPARPGFYDVSAGVNAKRTVLVSPENAATRSGTGLLNALAAITDASETRPYLLVMEPGVYDIGDNRLVMKPYVDIRGSGENVTTITGSNVDGADGGVVSGADHAELSFLTVENTGTGVGTGAAAIYNFHTSPRISNVTAVVEGLSPGNFAVMNEHSSCVMIDVTAIASNGTGTNYGIYNEYSSPVMTNVTATASGGSYAIAVLIGTDSSPTLTNVIARASSATMETRAVANLGSSPTLIDSFAEATGGAGCVGVFNEQSDPVLINVTASGSGGTNNYGMWNGATGGSYTVKVHDSRLTGAEGSIRNDAEFTTYVAATQLGGGAADANGGVLRCTDSYNEGFFSLSTSCLALP